jgi:HD-like signal output (HDOD) protein
MDRFEAKNIITNAVERLPSLPDVVNNILSLVEDEKASIRDLGNVVSHDYAISSQLLKVVNSAFYGLKERVSTVQRAAFILGFKEIKSLVMAVAAFKTLDEAKKDTSLNREELWLHSLQCSLAGQIISKKVGGVNPETGLTASLLHDIGKMVLDCFFTSEYARVLEEASLNGLSLFEVEDALLGFNHADAGGWLCEHWDFPPILVFPISFHHQVGCSGEYNRITWVVHLTDILCRYLEIGNERKNKLCTALHSAQKHLNLQNNDLDKIIEQFKQEEEKVKSFISSIKQP